MTETFFIGIIKFLTPKNICIDINFVTLTALELKLWHKTGFPDFDGGHFKNGPKQVVHPNFFFMASTFDIGGGPRSKKKLVSGCPVFFYTGSCGKMVVNAAERVVVNIH